MSVSSAGLLKAAVRQSPALSRQGLLERLFCYWFSGFVYNQIWEDPRVDIKAMALEPGHRLLTIASGGCNICHYLLAGAGEVAAVDLNIHHVNLSRLKLEAARRLPDHAAFFRFFGQADHQDNPADYARHIREHLPQDTRDYWDSRTFPLGRPRIALFTRNLYDHARMGRFLGILRGLCRLRGKDPARILAATNQAEQREVYQRELEPLLTSLPARLLARFGVLVFSLGIPPQQFRALRSECSSGVLDEYRERVERLACAFPLSDNYFAWQAFGRRYDQANRQGVPDYLKPENFGRLKAGAAKARVIQASLDEFLANRPERSLDRFVLLDSQDWMTPKAIAGLWEKIARAAKPGARVIFRTAGKASPVEQALPPGLRARFIYEHEISRELAAQDRSCIYGGFHLYRLAE
jgi:S-adenosylmethionine-diacylglycerol 3-amino-3-carboxypropyl transferase